MKTFYEIKTTEHGWGWGYGFFSNYRVCLDQLILYHEKGGKDIPYINWAGTTWVEGFNPFDEMPVMKEGNPFDQWFDQDIPQEGDTVYNHKYKICVAIDHARDYFDEPTELRRQQYVDRLYIKPKQCLIDRANEIYDNHLRGHTVLGVMARGTEYNAHHPMYGVFNVSDYIREISGILNDNKDIDKLFLVSEDDDYINILHDAFPSSYFVPNVFRKTDEAMEYMIRVHCWCNVSTKRKDHCRLLGEETIIQTKLLGKCDYLFGRFSGVLAGAVLWGDNIKKLYKI